MAGLQPQQPSLQKLQQFLGGILLLNPFRPRWKSPQQRSDDPLEEIKKKKASAKNNVAQQNTLPEQRGDSDMKDPPEEEIREEKMAASTNVAQVEQNTLLEQPRQQARRDSGGDMNDPLEREVVETTEKMAAEANVAETANVETANVEEANVEGATEQVAQVEMAEATDDNNNIASTATKIAQVEPNTLSKQDLARSDMNDQLEETKKFAATEVMEMLETTDDHNNDGNTSTKQRKCVHAKRSEIKTEEHNNNNAAASEEASAGSKRKATADDPETHPPLKKQPSRRKKQRNSKKLVFSGPPEEDVPGGWPDGWIKQGYARKGSDRVDPLWISPVLKHTFRSLKQAKRYLALLRGPAGGDESIAYEMLMEA